MATIAGVDEAGRGPVIGPMVMVGAMIDENKIQELKKLNVKDSKLLSPKQRNEIYPKLIKLVKYHIVILSPEQIDDALNSPNMNLNSLSSIAVAQAINALNPNKAIIDCPSPNTRVYTEDLKVYLKTATAIKCEHKADVNHLIVGAASIIAKVTRDRIIEQIKKQHGIEFGSGYPSDPSTQEFLKNNHEKYPEIFRKTWETYKKIADKKNQKSLEEF